MKSLGSIIKTSTAVLVSGMTLMTPMYAMEPEKSSDVVTSQNVQISNGEVFRTFRTNSFFNRFLKGVMKRFLEENPDASVSQALKRVKSDIFNHFGIYEFKTISEKDYKNLGFSLMYYIKNYKSEGDVLSFCELYSLFVEYFKTVSNICSKSKWLSISYINNAIKNGVFTSKDFNKFRNELLEGLEVIISAAF